MVLLMTHTLLKALLGIMLTVKLQIGLGTITLPNLLCVVHHMSHQLHSILLIRLATITPFIVHDSINLFLEHQMLCCLASIPVRP